MENYYDSPEIMSQFKRTIKTRDLRNTRRHAMQTYLETVGVKSLVSNCDGCVEKANMLEKIVRHGYIASFEAENHSFK